MLDSESIHILLAEDNQGDVVLLKRCFEKSRCQFKLTVVSDGKDVIGELIGEAATPPDLLILDINMPYVTGLEALENLRRTERGQHIPVLIYTSSKAYIDSARAKKLGAQGYIVKGANFTLDELISFASAAREDKTLWIHVDK